MTQLYKHWLSLGVTAMWSDKNLMLLWSSLQPWQHMAERRKYNWQNINNDKIQVMNKVMSYALLSSFLQFQNNKNTVILKII